MIPNVFQSRTLRTSLTLYTMGILLFSIWAMAFFTSQMLQGDMQRDIGEQQFSTATLVAQGVNDELNARINSLEQYAKGRVPSSMLSTPSLLQERLEGSPAILSIFNWGVFVTGVDGVAIASAPVSAGRVGTNYMDRDFAALAIKEGKPNIGKPVIGKRSLSPIVAIAVPLRDAQGVVIGALVGSTDLAKPNFLDKITQNRYGKSGGYLLIDPQNKLFVTATDKGRIMQSIPAPGMNVMLDRYLQGYEGFGVSVNSRGESELSAAKRIPVSGWVVMATLPMVEAFAPIESMKRRLLLSTIFFSLLAGALTWWFITRMLHQRFAPMLTASRALSAQTSRNQSIQTIPVTSSDEIGELITSFNQLLEILQKRDEYQRALIDNFPFAVWLKDKDSRFLSVNAGFVSLFGAKNADDLVGKCDFDIAPREQAEAYQADDRSVLVSRQKKNVEEEIVGTEGRRWFETYKAPVIDSDGELLGTVGFARDITDRRETEAALVHERAILRTLIDALPDLIWLKNTDGAYLGCNQRFEQFFGASQADIQGKTDYDFVDREVADLFRQYDLLAMAKNGPSINEEEIVFASDGHRELLETTKMPMRDAQGNMVGVLGIGHDITQRKASEKELEEYRLHLEKLVEVRTADLTVAKNAAEAASHAKSTFLANMSHELRTPMNGIMGMANVALRHVIDPKLRHQLETINHSSQHLLGVINDILDISKIEAGRLTLEQVEFSLGEVLDNLRALIEPKVAEKHLTLQFDVPASLLSLPLSGDPLRLGQILLNLSGNAVKFTEQGSLSIFARLTDETLDQLRLCCEIRDTGIGIDAEDQKRLFASFEQADSSMTRKYGGTGLGLVISKRLVEMMGGEIDVNSTPGLGSTFRFSVLLARGQLRPSEAAQTESAEALLKRKYAGAHILIAEDEPINQEVSRSLLEDLGLVVEVANDGAEALAKARQHRYALILMDMQMPILNGVDATRAIRHDSLNAHTPILAMTANAFEEDRQTCLAAGMDDHIGKPVDPDLLFSQLLAWLEPRP